MRLLSIAVLITASIFSCHKEDIPPIEAESLVGCWFNPEYTDSLITFEKAYLRNSNSYSLTLKYDGTLIERKNAGWCGTPPVTLTDFEGTWCLTDSIITVNVGYWGGNAEYQWKVNWIMNNKLQVTVLDQKYNFVLK